MAAIIDVAKYILEQNGEMSTMKLQKLCYYSQAWSLVWDDVPLFDEDFEAWANGPVCPDLFKLHKGMFSITSDSAVLEKANSNRIGDTARETINSVLEFYGSKSAQWLSSLTHLEDPWKNARENVADGEHCSNIITKESMMMYYSAL